MKCEKCVGKPFCTCKKVRNKKKPEESYRSSRRDRVQTHSWTPWVLARVDNPAWKEGHTEESALPGKHLVKICSRCGRVRLRKAA